MDLNELKRILKSIPSKGAINRARRAMIIAMILRAGGQA